MPPVAEELGKVGLRKLPPPWRVGVTDLDTPYYIRPKLGPPSRYPYATCRNGRVVRAIEKEEEWP